MSHSPQHPAIRPQRRALSTPWRALALLALVPTAHAFEQCFINDFGQEECRNTLSTGARIGIGVAIVVLIVVLIAVMGYMRRRRQLRQNLIYINRPQAQQQPSQFDGPGQYPYGNEYNGPPQYPPNAQYNSGYGQGGGYAPPPGPPQSPYGGYAPPREPPLVAKG